MPVVSAIQEASHRRDHSVRLAPGKNMKPNLKNSYSKNGWGHGSSGRPPCLAIIRPLVQFPIPLPPIPATKKLVLISFKY
jgi:hypothetical protein